MSTMQYELKKRGAVSLSCLSQILSGTVRIGLRRERDGACSDYAADIHEDQVHTASYGYYNLQEKDNMLRIRPTLNGKRLILSLETELEDLDAELLIETPTELVSAVISADLREIELEPRDEFYLVSVSYGLAGGKGAAFGDAPKKVRSPEKKPADPVERSVTPDPWEKEEKPVRSVPKTEEIPAPPEKPEIPSVADIPAIPEKDPAAEQLLREERARAEALRRNEDNYTRQREKMRLELAALEEKLERLSAETQKDYEGFAQKREELIARSGLDRALLAYYTEERELTSVEGLLSRAEELLTQAEDQIAHFVQARQKQSDEVRKAAEEQRHG